MSNILHIREGGIIYKAYVGDQDAYSIRKLWKDLAGLVSQMKQQAHPVLVLVDLSKLGKATLSARKTELELIKNVDFDRAAVFGVSLFNRNLAKVLVTASGRGYKIKFFNGEKEAIEWLKLFSGT